MLGRALRRVRNGMALCDGLGAYLRLEAARLRGGAEPLPVRVRWRPGAPLWFRNGTTDYSTLVSCFLDGYHRPVRPLPRDPVILDLGANVGYTMVDLRFHHPGARIVGVELDGRNLELARRNVEGLSMELLQAAVYHRDGEVSYDSEAAFDAFQARPVGQGSGRVPALTVGTLLDRLGLARADFVKLDVEGAEREILREGDLSWLDRVGQINIELHGGIPPEEVVTLLRGRGFQATESPRHWSAVVGFRG